MKAAYWKIDRLPGMSQAQCALLKACGVYTTKDLLEKTPTPQHKQTLANQLQLNIQYVNKWVALADLARIPSVGCLYCGLLLHSGIASVAQLIQTPVNQLHRQIVKLHVATMQRRDLSPPVEMVQQWIIEGRML